jgi:subtilisin family serine protease
MKRSVVAWGSCGLVLAVSILVACGGGSSGGTSDSPATPMSSGEDLRGTVVAGSADGAKVFLDLNNNQSYDAGEPLTQANADGAFTLAVGPRTAGELASAMLVAEVPETARDEDDAGMTLKEAGRGGMHLMAPSAAFVHVGPAGRQKPSRAVISPLTTMVAAEVAFNGLTPAQAVESVQQSLGLGDKDPLSDYKARSDTVLGNIARAAAITLGESPVLAAERRRPQLTAATTDLKTKLPSVIRDLGLRHASQAGVSVAAVKEALNTAPRAPRTPDASASALAASGNRFIIRFRDSVRDPAERGRNLAGASRGQLRHTYSRAIKGFSVTVPADAVQSFLDTVLQDQDVDHVEADHVVTTMATAQAVQANATWGLDRTDQRALPLNQTYSYFSTGAGVRAYVIDTGILSTHQELTGRVASGFTSISDGRGTADCNGHGTHVAATVGGTTWGMAKGVTLVPVRVLDCFGSGTLSGVIAGVDWMVANAVRPAVANMSLGGSYSIALNDAVANAVASGITVSVAAGNSTWNACDFSPAAEPSAITVGATGSTDSRASFSNFGTCVDVFAPGESITSAGIASSTAAATLSGTSMAAPHVAGLAALYLQSNTTATPAAVVSAIKAAATLDKVVNPGAGSPNMLIYTDLSSTPLPPDPGISDPDPGISDPDPGISDPDPGISEPVPPPPPPPPSLSVAALSGNSWLEGKNWRTSVTIAVKDASNALVPGVTVNGSFTAGGSKVKCVTAPNGTCVINSGKLATKVLQTKFSVTILVLKRGAPYDPNRNAATSVTIAKP